MTSIESSGLPPSCCCYHQPLRSFNRDSPFLRKQNNAKRKSAVELLQETKPLYVKSEIVLDRKQVLRRSLRNYETLGSPVDEDDIAARAFGPINENGTNSNLNVLTPIVKSPRLIPPISVRRSTGSFQLQNKLRKLITTDSKENLHTSTGEEETGKTECMSWSCGLPNPNNVINENNDYYKSLPDLSKNDELLQAKNDFHLSLTLTRKNSGKKGRIQLDAMSSVSCKNGHLHISTLEDNSCSKSERSWIIDDNVDVTSPISPSIGCIPPPPAYCDKRPEDEESIDTKIRSKSESDRSTSVDVPVPLEDSTTLDTFFDNLGLGSSEYQSLMAPRSDTSSPVYFSSGSSSLESVGEKESGHDNYSINYVSEGLSIVERNARIIKWLCNCRKSLLYTKHIPPPHSA